MNTAKVCDACDLGDRLNPQAAIRNKAASLAAAYQRANSHGDQNDCIALVAADLAAYGGTQSGPIGAAIAVRVGVPAARLVCRRIFP